MRHHTKDNGDIGVAQVLADLTKKGFYICLPLAEHLPFDMIAVSPDLKRMKRLRVKYRSKTKNGVVEVSLRQTASNANGFYHKSINLDEIDAVAIYCPNTDECYYVPAAELEGYTSVFALRLDETTQRQPAVRYARDYQSPSGILTNG